MNRIVIASGDEKFRGDLTNALTKYYHVFPFSNAEEAMEAMTTLRPDATLVDVNMPPKGGLSMVRQVRASDTLKNLSIVVITDKKTPAMSDEVKYSGADEVLVKPFRKSFLLKAVSQGVNLSLIHI